MRSTTAIASLSDITCYSDPKALEEYERNSGVEVSGSVFVNATPDEVFDAWISRVWLSGWTELAPGVGRGLVGHARLMPFGVKERIVSVGLPTPVDDRIASICYKVYDGGPFPVERGSHIGLVRFMPVKSGDDADSRSKRQTLVAWGIKTPTMPTGNLLCGGALFRLVLRLVLRTLLQTLLRSAETNSSANIRSKQRAGCW